MDVFSELSWRPTIGDPGFMGWFTVAAYGFGAALAVLASSRFAASNNRIHRRQKWLWFGVAGVMALLCVNKQLDLQSLLTDIGRVLARQQGWYEQRRGFQRLFVVGVLAASVGFSSWFILRFRDFWKSHKLLAGGMLFLLTFIVVRAISYHHFDVVIGARVLGVRMNWVFELTGIFLVSLAAARERLGVIKARTTVMPCPTCAGLRWICEEHPHLPWPHDDCPGPCQPCPKCNVKNPPDLPAKYAPIKAH